MKIMCTYYLNFALLGLLVFTPKASFAETPHAYDDAWWEAQYAKIYDTPECRDIILGTEKSERWIAS